MLRPLTLALAAASFAAPASAQTLSEVEVVRRAVAASPVLRAAVADVRAAEAGAEAAERALVPSLVLGGEGGYAESLGATAVGVVFNPSATGAANAGILARTAWGTTLEFGVGGTVSYRETNRDPSTTQSVVLGPYYGIEAALSIRQPLLAGTESYDASIRGARAGPEAAGHQRDAEASELMRSVLSAYWELWYAERSLAVQREALTVARRQHDEAQLRAERLGDLAPSEVLRFASEVASIEESVAQAEATRSMSAIELARLLSMPPAGVAPLEVDPAPPEIGASMPSERVMDRARARSSELLALAQSVEVARQRARGAADAAEPQLDVWARVGAASLYGSDMADPFTRPAMTAMAGVDLELPLGSSARQAQRDQAHAELDATEARYQARAEAIAAEAASAVTRLEAAARRVDLARRTADLAAQLAVAEERRLGLGASTPLELVAAQQAARAAELRHLRTLADHAAAALAIDHLTGALAERFARTLSQDA